MRPSRPSWRPRRPTAPTLRRVLPAPLPPKTPRASGISAQVVNAAPLPLSVAIAVLRPTDPRGRLGLAEGWESRVAPKMKNVGKRLDFANFFFPVDLFPRTPSGISRIILCFLLDSGHGRAFCGICTVGFRLLSQATLGSRIYLFSASDFRRTGRFWFFWNGPSARH